MQRCALKYYIIKHLKYALSLKIRGGAFLFFRTPDNYNMQYAHR